VVQSIINFVRLSYSGSPRLQCRYVIKALPQSILPRPYFYFLTMKSSFASRRQLRRVGQDDEDETSSDARPGLEREEQGTPSHFLIAAQISDKSTPTPRLTASSDHRHTPLHRLTQWYLQNKEAFLSPHVLRSRRHFHD